MILVFGVDFSPLRLWLGLPQGPWPPDHYTLLGLPTGHCDPPLLEDLVLARMELLRPHQLLHPELVTEGMNRLAQALICLTDPIVRSTYNQELGIVHKSEEEIPGFPIPTDDQAPIPQQESTESRNLFEP